MLDYAPVVVETLGVKLRAFQEAVTFVDVLIESKDHGVALLIRKHPGVPVGVKLVPDARIGENLSPCQSDAILSFRNRIAIVAGRAGIGIESGWRPRRCSWFAHGGDARIGDYDRRSVFY